MFYYLLAGPTTTLPASILSVSLLLSCSLLCLVPLFWFKIPPNFLTNTFAFQDPETGEVQSFREGPYWGAFRRKRIPLPVPQDLASGSDPTGFNAELDCQIWVGVYRSRIISQTAVLYIRQVGTVQYYST